MKGVAKIFRSTPTRGVRTGRRLAHWNELLEEWCLIHERYCRLVEGDAIYWNIERANLAALAAAAWRAGWAALEEFTQDKMQGRSTFLGRADLFLKSPDSQDYVESKIVWPGRGGTRPVNAKGTLRWLEVALTDARAVRVANGTGTRIGLAFAVPYFHSKVSRSPLELLTPFFDGVQDADLDAVAWCFPAVAQGLSWPEGRHRHVYPGVVLLAKVAV
jgi:hypothetical protein